ncbi:MAG: hypothetical protein K2J24_11035 [Muribaculaceae bacterium]|nr:hypothetical protein [Bacteroides sp.]MDE6844047.1 hypothetical protein [Muribaculaceae bacterium]
MDYTLTLNSDEDYRLIKKLLKAFDGASIQPVQKTTSVIEEALEEVKTGQIVGPFKSTCELMNDLLS